jgi:hypothetical protein
VQLFAVQNQYKHEAPASVWSVERPIVSRAERPASTADRLKAELLERI